MKAARNADRNPIEVRTIEGAELYGEALAVKPLIAGDAMTLLEIRYVAGSGSTPHVHDHESIVYVVRGRVRTKIGTEEHTLGPGDACRHPAGEQHSVEALDDALVVEIKSPPPNLGNLFGH
jgi:quercetin dioxygenase-like cupin family protein